MIRLPVLITALLAVPISAAADVQLERLLARVPDDAALVVVVPSVQKFAAGVAAFGKSIEVDELADVRPPELLAKLGLLDNVQGLDVGGPLVLATAPSFPTPVILARLKDADAWKQAVQAQPAEGGLLRVEVCCESACAAISRDVLIIGDGAAAVQSALDADGAFAGRLRTHSEKLLARHDLLVYVRLDPWRPMIDAGLMAAGTYMRMGMAMSGQADEAPQQVVKWLFDQAGRFMRDVDVFMLAVRAGTDGVLAQAVAVVRPDGPVGKYLSAVGRCKGHVLRGLPDENSALVFGCEWRRPAGTHSFNARMMEAMLSTDALRTKLGPDAFKKALQVTMTSYDLMSGYNATVMLPTSGQGMAGSGLYFTTDPQALMAGMRQACELSPEFMNAFGTGSTTDVTIRQERIGDEQAIAFDLAFNAEDPQVRQMLEMMYGQTTTMCMARHPHGAAFAMGPADAARARLSRMLGGSGPRLVDNARVVAAGRALSPDPQILVLLDLLKVVEFGLDTARASGAPVPPVALPKEPSAFIALGGYLEEDRCRFELFVPSRPVNVVVNGFRALKQPDDY